MTEEHKVYAASLNIPGADWHASFVSSVLRFEPDALPFTYFRDMNSNLLAFIPPQPEIKQ